MSSTLEAGQVLTFSAAHLAAKYGATATVEGTSVAISRPYGNRKTLVDLVTENGTKLQWEARLLRSRFVMPKAEAQTAKTHCQICARPILANTGLIAHHGYQRPQGWHQQTRSCDGARFAPYEESRDRIPVVRERLLQWVESQQAALDKALATPPETLSYNKNKYRGGRAEWVTVERPEGFESSQQYAVGRYADLYRAMVSALQRDVKGGRESAEYLQARFDSWVAPAEPAAQA